MLPNMHPNDYFAKGLQGQLELYSVETNWSNLLAISIVLLSCSTLTLIFYNRVLRGFRSNNYHKMAEASAADGKMKDLKISESKKKKDGNPQKAAKKPQQQKKKVGTMHQELWTQH
jgi:hypothetical protein